MLLSLQMVEEFPERYRSSLLKWLKAAEPLALDYPILQLMVTGHKLEPQDATDMRCARDFGMTIDRVLRRAPLNFVVLAFAGWMLLFTRKPAEAAGCLWRSLKLARHTPWELILESGIGMVYLKAGRYERVIDLMQNCLHMAPAYPSRFRMLAAAQAHLGLLDAAR